MNKKSAQITVKHQSVYDTIQLTFNSTMGNECERERMCERDIHPTELTDIGISININITGMASSSSIDRKNASSCTHSLYLVFVYVCLCKNVNRKNKVPMLSILTGNVLHMQPKELSRFGMPFPPENEMSKF